MKSLTVSQLRKDKSHYEELLAQKRQELSNLQIGIIRLEGAYVYVAENLASMEEGKPVFIDGKQIENVEFVED